MTSSEKYFQSANIVFMVCLIVVTLYPFWYVLILSLNAAADTMRGGVYWWPRRFTLQNYKVILVQGPILHTFLVSVGRVAVHVPTHLFVTGLAAYACARKEFGIRRFFITLFFITFLFGGGLIPYYLLINDLGIMNTFWVYIVPSLFYAWNFIIIKTFMQTTIEESLIEAAVMDGADHFYIFFKIVFPLSIPVFATIGLFQAVAHWNDWFMGAYFVFDSRLMPLQTYLQRLIRGEERELTLMMEQEVRDIVSITPKSLTMASIIIATGPILFVYPWIQKYFVKGIRLGSIKE